MEKNRNTYFLQDTVVVLQALALHSEKAAGNRLDLTVKVVTEIEGVDEAYHITPENRMLRKAIKVRIDRDYRFSFLRGL